jgi:type II secretory pathway predicted ATPase ExeA
MDESPFGLRERPFLSAPLTAAYFPTESLEQAKQPLLRCIERAEGIGMVVGAAGTGKSLLLQLVAQHFRSRFHVALLTSTGVCSRRSLLQNILFELNLPYRGLEEGDLRLALFDHLQPSRECPLGMLLLIDEAHLLPLRLLEEIRLLTNLVRDGLPRIRLVLAGSPLLEEHLTSPKLASFSQRLAARTYLHAFSITETANYIRHEWARCGGKAPGVFRDDALRAAHVATDGVPRLVNQVCDHALLLAAARKQRTIDAACIQEAWAELQQLPAPWNDASPATASIEFGALEFGTLDEATVLENEADHLAAEQDVIDPVHLSAAAPPATHATGEKAARAKPVREAEYLIPSLAELFGDDFTSEEIVIDRFGTLDTKVLGNCPQVTTLEGQTFAREVSAGAATGASPTLRLADLPLAAEEVAGNKTPMSPPRREAVPRTAPLAIQVASIRKRQADSLEHDQKSRAALIPCGLPEPIAESVESDVEPDGSDDAEFDPVYPELETVAAAKATTGPIVLIDQPQAGPPAAHSKSTGSGLRFRDLLANLRRGKY